MKPIYWDEEEASFLRVSEKLDQFYDELLDLLRDFLTDRGIAWDDAELHEAVSYQHMRIPACHPPLITQLRFSFNFPQYFESCYLAEASPLVSTAQVLTLSNSKDYEGDKPLYAKETILWGRKSGTLLLDATWRND